jgi:hypothetical protein
MEDFMAKREKMDFPVMERLRARRAAIVNDAACSLRRQALRHKA